MKCGTYMLLIALKPLPPPLQDPKCVVESLCQTKRAQFCRDTDDILPAPILGGPWSTVQKLGLIAQDFMNGGHFKLKKSHFCTFTPVQIFYCNKIGRNIPRGKEHLTSGKWPSF